jgi:hypothetical protein
VYFGFNMYPQMPYQSGITPSGPVFDSWRREFRALHKRGRLFMLMMHPQAIGRAGRIEQLEELLQEVVATDDALVTTCADAARRWQA